MTDPRLMISVSGIRGRVGYGLTPEVVARYASAFGAWAIAKGPSKAVVLGRDSRVTGPLFHGVTRAALESVGADVIDELRAQDPAIQILVHPECTHDVVEKADQVGSTEFIIKVLDEAPPGSSWAVGTELNLVKRLAAAHPDKRVAFLDRNVCYCSTMNRIDLPHLVWALESLVAGQVVNRIVVDTETEHYAKLALQRMLDLPGKTHRD